MRVIGRTTTVGLCGLVLAAVAYFALLSYVDGRLQDRSADRVYHGSKKIWATRGLVSDGALRNSIASVNNAFARGAPGTEVDVFFDLELGQFIVSHSRHYRLKGRELLTLERLFHETGGGTQYFWLDFKKMSNLGSADLQRSISRLEQITREHGLKERVYVESGNPLNLLEFQRAGFHTIFDTYPLKGKFPFWSLVINGYKIAYYLGGFSVMAMDYGDQGDPIYGAEIAGALSSVPVFLYHVPDDLELLNRLYASPSVRVILISQDSARFEEM